MSDLHAGLSQADPCLQLKGLSLEEIDKLFDDKAGEHERLRHQRIARDIGLEKLEHDLRHQENATRDV